MGELYSSLGLTSVWYAHSLIVLGQCLKFRFINLSTLEAFDVIFSIWMLNFMLSASLTPKYEY